MIDAISLLPLLWHCADLRGLERGSVDPETDRLFPAQSAGHRGRADYCGAGRLPHPAGGLQLRGRYDLYLLLGPVTAVLALNIYHQRKLLREYFWPVLAGCLAGTLTSVGSILLLCRLLVRWRPSIASALLPKSVTTAIALAIADSRRRHPEHHGGRCYHRRSGGRYLCPPFRQTVPRHRPGGRGGGHRGVQPRPGHLQGHGDWRAPGGHELHLPVCMWHHDLASGPVSALKPAKNLPAPIPKARTQSPCHFFILHFLSASC